MGGACKDCDLGRVTMITITVIGIPGPMGSKRFVGTSKAGRGILIESSKKVKPWREAVVFAAREMGKKISGPVGYSMVFSLPRPKSAPKSRIWPDRKPDLSKLIRSTEDALTDAGTWEDDSRVISQGSGKVFAGSGQPDALDVPGCVIRIWRAGE
jgi:Holliday junction resolvase RusA-like endonuclease